MDIEGINRHNKIPLNLLLPFMEISIYLGMHHPLNEINFQAFTSIKHYE